MSRRIKFILLSIFLLLLAIPAWHVGSNWNPPNPLRFRLVSRENVREIDGRVMERVEVEVLNTSTSPRYIQATMLKRVHESYDPFLTVFDSGTVIPAGGTLRGGASLPLAQGDSTEPAPLEIACYQASIARHRLLPWYLWLWTRLPEFLKLHLWVPDIYVVSKMPLESSF
ncbi:hypothetical protein [Roseimicrobium sp. ORNL1]|uniref:hypothetical protein n=1 Tax=Roseimicrobium sp. ORNL1 TaxID=2711231 RepID=UPI0013E1D5D4|nr:hypothetical protein [Roseimicrobium sp. ORNL1]QIF01962.1 hypothetical protein G5S37_10615 [Roseimicrobium sp. ORNL1]